MDIGKILGFSKSAAYHWESGKTPSDKTCERMEAWIKDANTTFASNKVESTRVRRMFNPSALTKKRQRLGISQLHLSLELGVTSSAVSAWENGKAIPNKRSLKAMRKFFKDRLENGHHGLTRHSATRIKPKRAYRSTPVVKKVTTSEVSIEKAFNALLIQSSKEQIVEAYKSLITR